MSIMEWELQKVTREFEIEGFNSIYYFEFGKDFTHPPEKHDFWELVYIDRGEINAVTNGLGRRLCQHNTKVMPSEMPITRIRPSMRPMADMSEITTMACSAECSMKREWR